MDPLLAQLNTTRYSSSPCRYAASSEGCVALDSNSDLAGIGVRLAFYVQSLMSALLVAFSPSDSVPTAWAGTLLTASLVIAAFFQGGAKRLTLHHATLVLNFSTLSSISSLAVAPTLPIWRLTPGEYYERERARHALTQPSDGLFASTVYTNVHKKQLQVAQKRARIILALALLFQVIFQWGWGIYLFVSWENYSQPECSGDTILVMFLKPFIVRNINSLNKDGARYLVWPSWIFSSLGFTLLLTIVLALSSPYRAQSVFSRSTNATTGHSTTTPVVMAWAQMARQAIPSWKDKTRLFTLACYVTSFTLWSMYVAVSEMQRAYNCISDGENDFGGFGQITAICVSFAPLWSLSIALYKYPARRRRRERHQAQLPVTNAARVSLDTADTVLPVSRNTGHIVRSPDGSSDEYEMSNLSTEPQPYAPVPLETTELPLQRRAPGHGVRRSVVRGPRPPRNQG